jgi:hypothetical protein
VFDRVVDQGLDEHWRDLCAQRRRVHAPLHLQSPLESHVFELEVLVNDVQFLGERDRVLLIGDQRLPQQLGEAGHHGRRPFRIDGN